MMSSHETHILFQSFGRYVLRPFSGVCQTREPSRNRLIDLVGRVFANGLGDLGSIPGRVIPKTLKWYLIPPCLTLSNIRYISRVKRSNSGKGVAPSPKHRCSSYWKGSLLVALDYGRQLYLLTSFIESTGVACSDSVSHNRIQNTWRRPEDISAETL